MIMFSIQLGETKLFSPLVCLKNHCQLQKQCNSSEANDKKKKAITFCVKEILLSSSSGNDKSHGYLSQHSFSLDKNLIMGSPKHEQEC